MPGNFKTYKSMDSTSSEDTEEVANFPTEYLNALDVSGIPPHELKLKIGDIVILLKILIPDRVCVMEQGWLLKNSVTMSFSQS